MIKKINITGIELDNYTVREAGIVVEKLLYEKPFVIIQEVDMDMLMLAKNNEVVKKAIELADLTIISEIEILEAAGEMTISAVQRKHEIDNRLQFFDLLKKAERNSKTVYVVGDTVAQVEQMKEFVSTEFSRLRIVGESALENRTEAVEAIINDINSAAADIILSILPSPSGEQFLVENKGKVSANLWYGIAGSRLDAKKTGLRGILNKYIKIHKLTKHINEYEEQEEES